MPDLTFLVRAYSRWRRARLARQDPARVQRDLLLGLVRKARGTRFGRDHDFAGIRSVEDFQARVPLRRYEDFWKEYWEEGFPNLVDVTWPGRIRRFAETSGTTSGRSKHIPVTGAMLRAFNRVAMDLLAFHVANRPSSRVLGGRMFMLGGTTALTELAPGICSGFISGIAARDAPWWIEPFRFPPRSLAGITDWDEKMATLAPRSLDADIRLIGGMTSWLLLFFDSVARSRPGASRRLVDYYPNLEVLVFGGLAVRPYRQRLERLLEGSHAELREVYPASEGFIGVGDLGVDDGLRLCLDRGVFYEFVPVEDLDAERPRRYWIDTVEKDVTYAIVLSTCAGLWSYVLGDTVRFVSLDPPRLVVAGRTSYYLSAFGEHLTGEEIERAVADAAAGLALEVADYSVGSILPDESSVAGRHVYVVEFSGGDPGSEAVAAFLARVDETIAAGNESYVTRRGTTLDAPEAAVLPPGSFVDWMRQRGKLGDQHKVPRVINDAALFQSLLDLAPSTRPERPG